jgi:hypothetical protein
MTIDERIRWRLVHSGLLIVTGFAVRKALQYGWRRGTGEPVPTGPEKAATDPVRTMVWAGVAALGAAAGRFAADRGAFALWRSATGEDPPTKTVT